MWIGTLRCLVLRFILISPQIYFLHLKPMHTWGEVNYFLHHFHAPGGNTWRTSQDGGPMMIGTLSNTRYNSFFFLLFTSPTLTKLKFIKIMLQTIFFFHSFFPQHCQHEETIQKSYGHSEASGRSFGSCRAMLGQKQGIKHLLHVTHMAVLVATNI